MVDKMKEKIINSTAYGIVLDKKDIKAFEKLDELKSKYPHRPIYELFIYAFFNLNEEGLKWEEFI